MTNTPREIWITQTEPPHPGSRYIRADVVVALAKAALEVPVVDNIAGRLALDKMLAAVRTVGIEPLDTGE